MAQSKTGKKRGRPKKRRGLNASEVFSVLVTLAKQIDDPGVRVETHLYSAAGIVYFSFVFQNPTIASSVHETLAAQ